MNAAVEEVPEPDEPRVGEEVLLNGPLVVDAEPLLPLDDLTGVPERVGAGHSHEVADPAVHGVQREHDGDGLQRPSTPDALAAGSGRGRSQPWGHGRALQA